MTEADDIQPSASIASTGKGIRYIGDHNSRYAYAYSGLIVNAGAADYEGLSFTSGSGIIIGEIRTFGFISDATYDGGKVCVARIKFNGESIALIKTEPSASDMPSSDRMKVVIPPFTLVEVTLKVFSSDANSYAGATLTGRVYGAD